MDTLQILFFLIFGATTVAGIYILVAKPTNGNWALAALLCGVIGNHRVVSHDHEDIVSELFFITDTRQGGTRQAQPASVL